MRFAAPAGLMRIVLVLLAAGVVTAAAAPLTWHAMGYHAVMPEPARLPVAQDVSAAPVDLSGTMALAPFGRPAANAPAAVAAEADLNLVLLGVIVRDDPARSMALISVNGTEANFRPGDTVSGPTELTEVLQDHVTLDTEGTQRELYFAGGDAPSATSGVLTGAERLAALVKAGGGPTISERVDAAQRQQPVSTQDYIDMWRNRIKANPGQVLESIGLVPTENGYMIAEEHDEGVNRAGLQAGDIVTSVNGQAVGNVDKDKALYDAVAASGLARIEVERNGRTIVMSFPLQ